jgi:hypothetical protein
MFFAHASLSALALLSVQHDPACRKISVTMVGSDSVKVTFPDRARCRGEILLISAGAPRRTGKDGRDLSLPVRMLNSSAYAIKSDAHVRVDPRERFAEDSTGSITGKVTPLNADSVRVDSREWVWHFRAPRGLRVGDSTGTRTLMIRIDSPVASAVVSFWTQGVQVTSMGWTLLTWQAARIDTTKLVQRPGTKMIMYRTTFMLSFKEGVSDPAKQAFFTEKRLRVLGVTTDGEFYVRSPDPGASVEAYDALKQSLRDHPSIKFVLEAYHSGAVTEQ